MIESLFPSITDQDTGYGFYALLGIAIILISSNFSILSISVLTVHQLEVTSGAIIGSIFIFFSLIAFVVSEISDIHKRQ